MKISLGALFGDEYINEARRHLGRFYMARKIETFLLTHAIDTCVQRHNGTKAFLIVFLTKYPRVKKRLLSAAKYMRPLFLKHEIWVTMASFCLCRFVNKLESRQ